MTSKEARLRQNSLKTSIWVKNKKIKKFKKFVKKLSKKIDKLFFIW